jgi:hypothetical protein
MNKWRDSCVRGQESLKGKVERFDKEITAMRQKYTTLVPSISNLSDEARCKEL